MMEHLTIDTMHRWIFTLFLLGIGLAGVAQKYKAVESQVHFFSDAPMEDIEAVNVQGSSVLELGTGSIVFSVPIRGFEFAKSLMQEHFNENYLESDKYPKAVMLGTMDPQEIGQGENRVTVTGDLTVHGVTRQVRVTGSMKRVGSKIVAHAEFFVRLADYNIKIPRAVFYNIAEEVKVTVDFTYEPY